MAKMAAAVRKKKNDDGFAIMTSDWWSLHSPYSRLAEAQIDNGLKRIEVLIGSCLRKRNMMDKYISRLRRDSLLGCLTELFLFIRLLQALDVDLLHLQHCLHHSF